MFMVMVCKMVMEKGVVVRGRIKSGIAWGRGCLSIGIQVVMVVVGGGLVGGGLPVLLV